MVNNILCSCGIDNNPIFHTDYFAIYRRQYRDDFCRSKIANGKWIYLIRIWILNSVFFSVTCTSNWILYAQPIADVISAIVTVFMAIHLHKELATTKEH